MTRWAKNVSPTNALPEYPRPQMVRKDWLNLNGLWDIKLGDGTETRILVPFAIESALSGVMKHSERMTYRRGFEIPKDWSNRHVLLHFGAVDWETKVCVNGKQLGVHRGGYDAFSFDITAALKPQGTQEIVVEVFDPTDLGGYARGKQTLTPKGIMYTPTSGIWQTVWLEPVAEAHIESLHLTPDLDGACLRLTVDGTGTVEVVASDAGKEVAKVGGEAGSELKLAISNPKLWSPDSPHLYDLSISLKSGDKTLDTVTSYFGMRKISLGKDENGVTRLMLNNKFVFQVGPLDQGFWPDGLYTAPTDEALRFDVTEMKRLGFNVVRKHIKVEPDRWYTWCDKLGLLVWQDMPSVNSYAAKPQPTDKAQFKTELERMVTNHANHPAIIMWVLFNEAQGQHDDEGLTAAVRAIDPSRLINVASGGPDRACSDVIDMHSYPGPDSPKPDGKRATVLGEFGGLGLAVDGHRWTSEHWGYQGTKDAEELTRGYEDLLAKAWALKNKSGLSAVIYTQLTDLETECNGLLTYDREVNKVVPERAAAVNTGIKKIEIPNSVVSSGKQLKLACVGDSITEGFCVNKGMTWPEQIGRMLGSGWAVRNFGRGGMTLVSYQQTPEFKNAKELNPDVVVIMLGTNESRPVLWKTAKAGFAGDYGAMVKQFAELPSKPRVFLCYPPFVANDKNLTENDFSEACILEQIPLVDEAAKAAKAGVIDIHGALKAKGKAAYNPDGGHPNDAGQTIIATTVHAALANKAAANGN